MEALARKSPQEFVALLEQISQSSELKEEYEKALAAKEEAEAGTLFCFNKQKGMKGERRLVSISGVANHSFFVFGCTSFTNLFAILSTC